MTVRRRRTGTATRAVFLASVLVVWNAPGGHGQSTQELRPQEIWRAQGDRSGFEFSRVIGGTVMANGSLAVLDAREFRVVLIDSTGRPRQTVGAKGSGPGEFQAPATIGRIGDSLWVGDSRTSRVTIFDSRGLLVRTMSIASIGVPSLTARGDVLVASLPVLNPNTTNRTVRVTVDRPGGPSGAVLLDTTISDPTFTVPIGKGWFVGPQPFSDHPLVRLAQDGSAIALIDRTTRRGASPDIAVTLRRSSGEIVYRLRTTYRPVPLDRGAIAAAVDSTVAALLPHVRGTSRSELATAVRGAMVVPAHRPSVTEAIALPDGSVWLRREDTGQPQVVWTVVNGRGTVVGQVLLPRSARVLAVEGRVCFVNELDADGVSEVVKYRW